MRLQEIKDRKLEIRTLLEGNATVDLDALGAELKELDVEVVTIEKRKSIAAAIAAGTIETTPMSTPESRAAAAATTKETEIEKRGKALLEKRSVTVASSGILLAAHKATDIKTTFNEVSGLIDRVTMKPLIGGESFTQPYSTGYGEGDYTAEGVAYDIADATFASASIAKTKITAYSEESEEVMKLGAADYDSIIVSGITVGLRKKITKEILIGDGTAGKFVGIFDNGATAIDALTDISISEIDETTLDEITYAFGGDEDVEDAAVLVLNKKDLAAFAKLRDGDGKKVYTIVNNGNTGTIDGVQFLLNSACKAVVLPATVSGEYCMAYGPLSNYTMAVFSNMEVQRSTDFKFSTGMIAHKGVIFAGGNVTAKNGFLRVKKT